MTCVRVLHWKEAEAKHLLAALRSAGYQIDYTPKDGPGLATAIRKTPPSALVIDLSCRPAAGREFAVYIRGTKATRRVPIVFVGGDREKVDRIRALIPDAAYTTTAGVAHAVKRAIANPPLVPVIPLQMMERRTGRPTALKMGIKAGTRVALFDPPDDYERVLGPMPEGVSFDEGPGEAPVSVWFVRDADVYVRSLAGKRTLAARSKLWIVWPKGQRNGINQFLIRQAAIELGLVDYKICSVNEIWTGMLFAVKKAQ